MSSKPSLDFGVRRGNKLIFEFSPGNTISTGISYDRHIAGIVPYFEEYDAMIKAGYNSIEWLGLSHEEKANSVAYQRLKRLISLNENDAVQKHVERERKRNKRKKR